MKSIRIASAALNQTPLDWDGNARRIKNAWDMARAADVTLLCLPELCLSGYGCEDRFLSPSTSQQALAVLVELLPATSGLVTTIGLPLHFEGRFWNAVAMVADGKLQGFRIKSALAGQGIEYEPRWFTPWEVGSRNVCSVAGQEIPLGDLVFDLDGIRIGFEVCEECWRTDRPAPRLRELGVQIVLNPSASFFAIGKYPQRRELVLKSSQEFKTAYVYANLLGCEAGRIIYDGHCLIGHKGILLAESARLSLSEVSLCSADLTIETPDRAAPPTHLAVPMQCPRLSARSGARVQSNPTTYESPFEEFTAAVTLGLLDYMRKSRSHGYVVSLSGGADSSATAALCAYAIHRMAKELLDQERAVMYPHLAFVHRDPSPHAWVKELLTCVFQGTHNNSPETRQSAAVLARELGCTFVEFEVDALVRDYTSMVERSIHRQLSWENDDLALQNVQSRVRAPGVWLIANLKRALLLCTANRSEVGVGYSTMDGDTAGGLSPLAGIDKAFLREWVAWAGHSGPAALFRVSSLATVAALAPSAELRPLSTQQADEKDLMPYPVLQAIEAAAIRDRLGVVETFLRVAAEFESAYTVETLRGWVRRFFVLWSANQWKRERYAPGFHLEDYNLDPRSWCRFPILSGGFVRELRELEGVHYGAAKRNNSSGE
ncbi:MAG: nitrilase-related carbon-nitrogen hydrolase [Bdellovibrionota bacterium]|nr:MAG: nitrilase-related carbon-nitrogen hydrolase [Bdellovibrionota bacterium]